MWTPHSILFCGAIFMCAIPRRDTTQLLDQCIVRLVRELSRPDDTVLVHLENSWPEEESQHVLQRSDYTSPFQDVWMFLRNTQALSVYVADAWPDTLERLYTPANIILIGLDAESSINVTRAHLTALTQHPAWTNKAHFVVTITGSLEPKGVLQEFWDFNVTNVLTLSPSEGSVLIYSWSPYSSSEECAGPVQNIQLLDTWDGGKFLNNGSRLRRGLLTNLHGCAVTVATFSVPPFVILEDDDSTVYEGGIDIEMIRLISEYSNSTLNYLPPDPNEWFGVYATLKRSKADVAFGQNISPRDMRGDVDVTLPYVDVRFDWYIPCARSIPRWKSIVRVFSPGLWTAVFGSFVTTSLLCWFVAKVEYRLVSQFTFFNELQLSKYFLSSFSSLVLVGLPTLPIREFPKIIYLLWILESFILNSAYQSSLIKMLIDPGMMPPLKNLEELAQSGLEINLLPVVRYRLDLYEDQIYKTVLKLASTCYETNECLRDVATYRNSSTMVAVRSITYYTPSKYARDGKKLICDMGQSVLYGHSQMWLRLGSPLTDMFNRVIQSAVETGLVNKWEKDIQVTLSIVYRYEGGAYQGDEQTVLTLTHLQGVFFILSLGLLTAFIIFLGEVTVHKMYGSSTLGWNIRAY